MNDVKTKQQIAEKIKSSMNILVTVSNDPSVDELSAALGLTIMLNKLEKHATAVFSGAIPPAITFLDPEKTFESTTDSLRDFIIALDKEKADHLRYKVEGDSVKIFITPYRTTITSDDLDFSQGDYNVELVLALGVNDQDHLDAALEAHGRILHDATVVTVTAGTQTSNLGSIDWHDETASSLSEMLVSLTESLKSDKPILDKQIATALLTGVVASTDRFSNPRTTSKVMTIAAQLMAAGADQQLIAAKLQESHAISNLSPATPEQSGDSTQATPASIDASGDSAQTTSNGELDITHDTNALLDEVAEKVRNDNQEAAEDEANQQLAEEQARDVAPVVEAPVEQEQTKPIIGAVNWNPSDEPTFGGTLNATADQAEDDARRELLSDQNKTTLSHSYLGEPASQNSSTLASEGPKGDIFAPEPLIDTLSSPLNAKPYPTIEVPANFTLADIDANNRSDQDQPAPGFDVAAGILNEVHESYAPPAVEPTPVSLPQPPPLPDFSTLPPPTVAPAYAPEPPETERLGDIFAPDPASQPSVVPPANSNDPGQFKIPGQ